MEWMGLIVTAGIATVLICAGVFELLERRKRAAFQQQIHDLAQKYINRKNTLKSELPGMGRPTRLPCG